LKKIRENELETKKKGLLTSHKKEGENSRKSYSTLLWGVSIDWNSGNHTREYTRWTTKR